SSNTTTATLAPDGGFRLEASAAEEMLAPNTITTSSHSGFRRAFMNSLRLPIVAKILTRIASFGAEAGWKGRSTKVQVQSLRRSMWWLKRQSGRAEPALERLGSLESELMEHIWPLEADEVSVRDLHSKFAARLAYTTIMTTLDRLYKK